MAILYIADTHFGHENIIRFDNRPFANVEMMKNDMIERWNKKAGKNDTVYILGDFCWKNVNPLEMGAELNGRKVLITGNHDRELSNKLVDSADLLDRKSFLRLRIMVAM